MLFFKLYNWIKYKTLPSSFLFKNRLFIERDSKHRRIVNNFGLVFRNSKWSMYENTNVALDFKRIFFKFFIYFICLMFFIYLAINFNLLNNFFFNLISFFFWFTLDSFDYYLSFFLWSFLSFISVTISKLYFLLNNKNIHSNSLNNTFTNKNDSVFLSKTDLNWIMYSWLTSKNSSQIYNVIEFLFDSSVSKKKWLENHNFFFNLYKTIFFLNLNKNNFFFYDNLYKNLMNNNSNNFYYFFNNTLFLNNYFNFINSFYFKAFSTNFYRNNKKFSSFSNSKWTLNSLFLEDFKYNFLINSKKGGFIANNFFILELSDFKNSKNFLFFQNLLFKNNTNNFLTFSKWNRWLYRYSLLHRKSIKFAQKLTFTKKLLNSGFYNSSIFKKNLWNSVYFSSKNLDSTQITTLFDTFFNDFLKKDNYIFTKKAFTNSFLLNDHKNFSFFKFFETSYFWHLKRFFIFNSLNTNLSFLKVKKYKKFIDINNNILNSNQHFFNNLYFNFFINNRNFYLNPLNIICLNNCFINIKHDLNSNIVLHDDSYLIQPDLDLFSKNNLFILNSISSNSALNFTFFFNNLNYNFNCINFNDKNFYTLTLNNFFFYFFFNHLLFFKNNIFYFKDLFLFNIYVK